MHESDVRKPLATVAQPQPLARVAAVGNASGTLGNTLQPFFTGSVAHESRNLAESLALARLPFAQQCRHFSMTLTSKFSIALHNALSRPVHLCISLVTAPGPLAVQQR
jgi:hypothetical protein